VNEIWFLCNFSELEENIKKSLESSMTDTSTKYDSNATPKRSFYNKKSTYLWSPNPISELPEVEHDDQTNSEWITI